MKEIIFIVRDADEGGYVASSLEYSIFTDGDTLEELKGNVAEAVRCHFEDEEKKLVRLQMMRDEVFSV